jgi:hypothetical protein
LKDINDQSSAIRKQKKATSDQWPATGKQRQAASTPNPRAGAGCNSGWVPGLNGAEGDLERRCNTGTFSCWITSNVMEREPGIGEDDEIPKIHGFAWRCVDGRELRAGASAIRRCGRPGVRRVWSRAGLCVWVLSRLSLCVRPVRLLGTGLFRGRVFHRRRAVVPRLVRSWLVRPRVVRSPQLLWPRWQLWPWVLRTARIRQWSPRIWV